MSTGSGDKVWDAICADEIQWESSVHDLIKTMPYKQTKTDKINLIIEYIERGLKISRRFHDCTIMDHTEYKNRVHRCRCESREIDEWITQLRARLKTSDLSDEKYIEMREKYMSYPSQEKLYHVPVEQL